jgi:hypothetical protein
MTTRLLHDYSVETTVPPERMLSVAADVSARRPDYWPNITRSYFRVYSVDDGMAEIDEGTRPNHHRVRYEWSGDTVRGVTTVATGVVSGSVWQVRARPRMGGGSIVDVHMDYTFKHWTGFVVWVLPDRLVRYFFKKSFLGTVDILEREQQAFQRQPVTERH